MGEVYQQEAVIFKPGNADGTPKHIQLRHGPTKYFNKDGQNNANYLFVDGHVQAYRDLGHAKPGSRTIYASATTGESIFISLWPSFDGVLDPSYPPP